jgi:hypothetical protein
MERDMSDARRILGYYLAATTTIYPSGVPTV